MATASGRDLERRRQASVLSFERSQTGFTAVAIDIENPETGSHASRARNVAIRDPPIAFDRFRVRRCGMEAATNSGLLAFWLTWKNRDPVAGGVTERSV
jgi:hypothetical protein